MCWVSKAKSWERWIHLLWSVQRQDICSFYRKFRWVRRSLSFRLCWRENRIKRKALLSKRTPKVHCCPWRKVWRPLFQTWSRAVYFAGWVWRLLGWVGLLDGGSTKFNIWEWILGQHHELEAKLPKTGSSLRLRGLGIRPPCGLSGIRSFSILGFVLIPVRVNSIEALRSRPTIDRKVHCLWWRLEIIWWLGPTTVKRARGLETPPLRIMRK